MEPIRLSGELTFATVPARLGELQPRVSEGAVLDLSGVTHADSAGISLLLELARQARARNQALRLTGATEQIRKLVGFFGLGELLPLDA